MKIITIIGVFAVSLLLASCSNQQYENQKTVSFKVYGNCSMCEKTIEKSLDTDEVSKGDWDKNTKMMVVSFDSTKISENEIKQRIASVGYDTEEERATEAVYNGRPTCCQYKRPE